MYEKIYDLIIHSEKLSDVEKSELIESIRMSVIGLTSSSLEQDIDDFRNRERFHKKNRTYKFDIKSEPISLLFIRFMEQNDVGHLVEYRYAWNNSDKKDKTTAFALILAILSVLTNLYKKGKREYLFDINIDPKVIKSLFQKCELLNIQIENSTLEEFYHFINQSYLDNKKETDISKRSYGFHPKFMFVKSVVDTFFAYLYWKNQKELSIQEVAKLHNLDYKKGIEKIIFSLTINNKKSKAK